MPLSSHKEEVIASSVMDDYRKRLVERVPMSMEVAIDLVLCGLFLAGLSSLARYLQGDLPAVTLLTGLVCGGLCVLWGVLGRSGMSCCLLAIATLTVAAWTFVRQSLQSLDSAYKGESKDRMVIALMTVMVVLSVGILVKLIPKGKGLQS